MKDCDNGTGRIARLELGSEWMCKQVVLSSLLVFVQSIIDDELEVRALTRGRGGGRLSMRHEGEIRWFVRTREDDGGFVGDIGDRAEGNTLGATLRPGRKVRRYSHHASRDKIIDSFHLPFCATVGFLPPSGWSSFSK